jgi:uncharacterized membrane protein
MLHRKLLVVTGLAGIAQSLYFYSILPDRVAIHFGSAGLPDAWASNTTNLLISICLYASTVTLFLAIPYIVKSAPYRLISLPKKAYWLSKERADATASLLTRYFSIFGTILVLFLMAIGYLVFLANMSLPVTLNEIAVWSITGGFLLFTILWLFYFYRTFNHTP